MHDSRQKTTELDMIVLTAEERTRFTKWCKQRADECERYAAESKEDPKPLVYGFYAETYNSMCAILGQLVD